MRKDLGQQVFREVKMRMILYSYLYIKVILGISQVKCAERVQGYPRCTFEPFSFL